MKATYQSIRKSEHSPAHLAVFWVRRIAALEARAADVALEWTWSDPTRGTLAEATWHEGRLMLIAKLIVDEQGWEDFGAEKYGHFSDTGKEHGAMAHHPSGPCEAGYFVPRGHKGTERDRALQRALTWGKTWHYATLEVASLDETGVETGSDAMDGLESDLAFEDLLDVTFALADQAIEQSEATLQEFSYE